MSSQPESNEAALPTAPAPAAQPAIEAVPDREARNPYYRYLMHVLLPVGLSGAVHLVILALAGFYAINIVLREPIEVGEWSGSLREEDLSQALSWADSALLESPDDLRVDESFESLSSLIPTPKLDLADIKPDAGAGSGDGGLGLGDGALSLLGTGSGAGESGTGGFGSGLGGGARIGQAGLWDLTIQANKVVYVVDFSGSIIVAVDDLKRELKRSIGRLRPSQSFNVILFYSSGGGVDERVQTESFKPKLEAATPETRREFFAWIDRKAPTGVTEPLAAMKRAMSLAPEAIFFFSDGYFDDGIVTEIERENRRARTRVYCLVFDEVLLQDASGYPRETEGSRRLRRIADANGGKVKIVTAKDLAR